MSSVKRRSFCFVLNVLMTDWNSQMIAIDMWGGRFVIWNIWQFPVQTVEKCRQNDSISISVRVCCVFFHLPIIRVNIRTRWWWNLRRNFQESCLKWRQFWEDSLKMSPWYEIESVLQRIGTDDGWFWIYETRTNWPIICRRHFQIFSSHYSDAIMSAMTSQIAGVMIVYSTVWSGVDQRKHQSSASLAFVREIHRWPANSPHNGPVTRKMFSFDDVIMNESYHILIHIYWHLFLGVQ